ncbi:MAG TPA: hypothetical protein VFB85_00400 [Vicinamibacterales bacterium]|jgi:hypothetical protein|nr:hypothetical protein [Vicinamibacterales bacterium]
MTSAVRLLLTAVVTAVFVVGFAAVPATQSAQSRAVGAAGGPAYSPAKTPWGDPDLQGTYTNKDENGIPMERPNQFDGKRLEDVDDSSEFADIVRERNERAAAAAAGIGGRDTGAGPVHWYEHYNAKNSRAWLVTDPPDGKIPALTPAGQKAAAERTAAAAARRASGRGDADSWLDRSLYDRCITRGVPGSMMPAIYGNAYDITQAPGVVAIRYEMIHETRVIPLDDSARPGKTIASFMGAARGRWDGNTLVVETKNFNDRGAYRNANPDSFVLVERFTPVAPNKVQWSVTINDPATWTRPWTYTMQLTRDSSQPLFEYGCHEGNYGLRNILSAARAEEAAAKSK